MENVPNNASDITDTNVNVTFKVAAYRKEFTKIYCTAVQRKPIGIM